MIDCIFCKIIDDEIPSYKLYEDDEFLAFLDVSQTTKGHTLVVPKDHVKDIFHLNEDVMARLYKVVNVLTKDICKKLGATGVNILNNNGSNAGQTVFHYHVHIIPRYDETDKIQIKFLESALDASNIHNLLIEDKSA